MKNQKFFYSWYQLLLNMVGYAGMTLGALFIIAVCWTLLSAYLESL